MNIFDFIKDIGIKKPWKKFYKAKDLRIEVPNISIYEMFRKSALKYKERPAINYYGKIIDYDTFLAKVNRTSKAFRNQGIRYGDVVTICMPNTPEALICFYALNRIGAICNFIHPLSGEEEIKHYIISTKSVMLIMIDLCYDKIKDFISETDVYKVIIVSASCSMPLYLKIGYILTQSYKINKPKRSERFIYFRDFMRIAEKDRFTNDKELGKETPAVILHSGGTTGTPKGIVLSNGNFNALSEQAKIVFADVEVGDRVLGIMPIFHGFGLGVSINTPFVLGCEVILVPQFNSRKFDKLLEKYHPNVMFGVPTLYEALTNTKNDHLDLSGLKYAISGGDSLSKKLSDKINKYLEDHKAKIRVSQGFGMTESLAAVTLAYGKANVDGSIGIPFPGTNIKMVKPGTQDEVPYGEDGEICINGPTVMLGYLDNEKETNEMLQIHKDGVLWLHTGDMGMMTKDGIIYYRQRIKRMIISSGYNIYPSRVEEVIESYPAVLNCTVVGIPHPYKVEVAKAYIVLKRGHSPLLLKEDIINYCKKNLAAYCVPYEFEFRKSLPKTLIGKVDFKKLQQENNEIRAAKKNDEK